jgi:hypothetical protein
MGLTTWRNLSVLAVASIALIGCNNGAQKSTSVVSNDPTKKTTATAQNQPPGSGFTTAGSQFPTKSVTPAGGPGAPPFNPSPSNMPPGGGANPMPDFNKLAPLPGPTGANGVNNPTGFVGGNPGAGAVQPPVRPMPTPGFGSDQLNTGNQIPIGGLNMPGGPMPTNPALPNGPGAMPGTVPGTPLPVIPPPNPNQFR